MKILYRGLGLAHSHGPTLRSVRRMNNLRIALKELNRRVIGVDGFPYEAWIHTREYILWEPDFLELHGLEPLKTLQEGLAFGEMPDATKETSVKNRIVERGTVRNSIVERAITRKLQQNLDRCFANSSWAYRPRRSPEKAIQGVRTCIRQGAHWVLKTDIHHFFPNVDRAILLKQLHDTIRDPLLVDSIMTAISPCVLSLDGTRIISRTGLPQGNGISPFLSNLYLHCCDIAFSSFLYFRYSDDILVLAHTKQSVVKARAFLKRRLAQLGLQLNGEKTIIRDLYREPVVFLGYELRGGNIYPPQKAVLRLEKGLQFRGQDARLNLMRGFVRRYRIGPVRKLFRRIDRDLRQLFPPGSTLVGLLDNAKAKATAGGRNIPTGRARKLRHSRARDEGLPRV